MNSIKEAAQKLAAEGLSVFPVRAAPNGKCSCGRIDCASPGKHPVNSGWQKRASSVRSDVDEMFPNDADQNIGVRTGDVVVIDVDVALEELNDAQRLFLQKLPPTRTVRTDRGTHFYFWNQVDQTIANKAGLLGPKLDVRGAGGYVVAPGSRHASGARYEWVDEGQPIAELPDEVVEMLRAPRARNESWATSPEDAFENLERFLHGGVQHYVDETLEQACFTIRTSQEGFRNDVLLREAAKVGHLVASGWIPDRAAKAKLLRASVESGLGDEEAQATIRNAFTYSAAWQPLVVVTENEAFLLAQIRGQIARLPALFLMGSSLVTLAGPNGSKRIEIVSDDFLRVTLLEAFEWKKIKACKTGSKRTKGQEAVATFDGHLQPPERTLQLVPCKLPSESIKHIRGLVNLSLPRLLGITKVPQVMADGSIKHINGYDSKCEVYFDLDDEKFSDFEARVSAMSIEEAKGLLLDSLLGDFPFASSTDKAAALAFVLTPLVRTTMSGSIPLFALSANNAGAGKTMLANVVAILTTGEESAPVQLPQEDEELRKKITSMLLAALPIAFFDNISRPLAGDTLAAFCTASRWHDRLLGVMKSVELENKMIAVFTGNGITVQGDLKRRVLISELESPYERPEQRNDFQHPDLVAWVKENRVRLLQACAKLLMEKSKAEPLTWASFGGWTSRVADCVLESTSINPLGNRDRVYEDDPHEETFVEFLRQLRLLPEGASAHEILTKYPNSLGAILQSLDDSKPLNPKRVGILLRPFRNRAMAGLRLVQERTSTKRIYLVEAVNGAER